MHLDDTYVKLATSVLQFGAAYFSFRQIALQKKPKSVPRGIHFLKKSEDRRRNCGNPLLIKKLYV